MYAWLLTPCAYTHAFGFLLVADGLPLGQFLKSCMYMLAVFHSGIGASGSEAYGSMQRDT